MFQQSAKSRQLICTQKMILPNRLSPKAPMRFRAMTAQIHPVVYRRLSSPEMPELWLILKPLLAVSINKKGAPIRANMPSVLLFMMVGFKLVKVLIAETKIVTTGAQVKAMVIEMRWKRFKASEAMPEG